jgi:hypothetical protein
MVCGPLISLHKAECSGTESAVRQSIVSGRGAVGLFRGQRRQVALSPNRLGDVQAAMSTGRQRDSNGSSSVDYDSVDLPDTEAKPRTEWHYTERRAEILQLIYEAGHPRDVNQSELSERYGVSQQQISKDFKRIGQAIREGLDDDRRALSVHAVVQRSIRGLLDGGEFYKAGQLAIEWDDWVSDTSVRMGDRAKDSGDGLPEGLF